MKEIAYQQKAVQALTDKIVTMLGRKRDRQKLVFKAPTGSGKTIMASEVLWRLTKELPMRSECQSSEVAYIWIAPNKLHEQSYFKMKSYVTETNVLRPVMYDELDLSASGTIHAGEILFVNWESINKDNAIMVRASERQNSLFEITDRTKKEGRPIVCIIDEEHLFGGRMTNKAEKVLQAIGAKIEFRISATPITMGDDSYTIDREDVIREQMIKCGIVLNPALERTVNDDFTLNQCLLSQALKKRNQLAEAYKKVGSTVKPLLLVQLPNDTVATLSSEEVKIVDEVKTYLDKIKDITTDNGKLAVWLSNEKTNLEGIEQPDSLVEVLLFKQAIAMGWDCPRAAVLLIFRQLQSTEFSMQTIGRILRMPEQHYYADQSLNQGYIYTDLSKDMIHIIQGDMDYISKLVATRREALNNVSLTSYYRDRPSIQRNRLSPSFKTDLYAAFGDVFGIQKQREIPFDEYDDTDQSNPLNLDNKAQQNRLSVKKYIRFDVKEINIEIPQDVKIKLELGTQELNQEKFKYARSFSEIDQVFRAYCRGLLGDFEKVHSTDVLANYLLEALEDIFELFQTEAKKVVLYHQNKPQFTNLITKALARHKRNLEMKRQQQEAKSIKETSWCVPEQRIYDERNNTAIDTERHAMVPFVRLKNVSTPEKNFERFLEQNKEHIEWWYKNGDEGMQNYAIRYDKQADEQGLFYVDFVIKMKNGQVFLFDTKSPGSDPFAPQKHNALLQYMKQEKEQKSMDIQGGIVIEQNDVWYYSRNEIVNTEDLSQWQPFFPKEYGE